ncbi:uncharacterized protein EI97DRAFT_242397 [Westerdykella ornata]|uniref:Uncharacterized protein n=1 Tax=Westerdykella ornata TaxID=318751 RepID=A0A6A6J5M5_WESOR|nr:uncharacterized protein EI97DRAFT_242397 [Westerdykella ornata]KAF2271881.1 hypothetical protein EI97DRAFT_242397 [Westerdykella ornata]
MSDSTFSRLSVRRAPHCEAYAVTAARYIPLLMIAHCRPSSDGTFSQAVALLWRQSWRFDRAACMRRVMAFLFLGGSFALFFRLFCMGIMFVVVCAFLASSPPRWLVRR